MANKIIIQANQLTSFVGEIFERAGFSAEHAGLTAEAMVWADLRGHPSHGVMRLPSYLGYIPNGYVNPEATFDIDFEKGALVRANANMMIGPAALNKATSIAIERAKETAVSWVLVKDHSHAGAAGQYAKKIADAGMIGIVMIASRPMMAYHGTANAVLGTNPIAVAIPDGPLIDMSTAAIAKGKFAAFAASGKELPPDVALTAGGVPTTDPENAAMPLPLGGPKGAGLSLMIECVTSIALSNPLVATALADPKMMTHFRLNAAVIAMDVATLGDEVQFRATVAETMNAIRQQPKASGVDEIMIAGERGERDYQRGLREGVVLSEKAWSQLVTEADKLSIAVPAIAA